MEAEELRSFWFTDLEHSEFPARRAIAFGVVKSTRAGSPSWLVKF